MLFCARYKTLVGPVMVHGTFDYVIFMLMNGVMQRNMGSLLGLLIVVSTFLYVRSRYLSMVRAYPQEDNVHTLMKQGLVKPPLWWHFVLVCAVSILALIAMLALFISRVRLV